MPLSLAESAVFSAALCGVLCYLAYREDVLTLDGTIAAFFVGLVIGILGDVTWLLLLLFFLLSSFIATRYKFALKEAMGVQEGRKGERRASNVLANGVAPMAAAVLSFAGSTWFPGAFPRAAAGIVFLAALAVAGSDTLASEIGVLSPRPVLITTFERVTPGTDGGISVLGEACALLAAVYTALFGWLVLGVVARTYALDPTMPMDSTFLVVPAVIGFVGCQLDSVIGATLERRGIVNKKTTNLLATCTGAVLAYLILVAWVPGLKF